MPKDARLAVEWFLKAAEQGDADAQCALGMCYMEGGKGVRKNRNTALKWFRKAAKQGDATAQEMAETIELQKETEQKYKVQVDKDGWADIPNYPKRSSGGFLSGVSDFLGSIFN